MFPNRTKRHENVRRRLERYVKTSGLNRSVNKKQFNTEVNFKYEDLLAPDLSFSQRMSLEIGGTKFELFHAIGETDDATYVFIPEERVLVVGDFIIWNSPNASNPNKVQRFPEGENDPSSLPKLSNSWKSGQVL